MSLSMGWVTVCLLLPVAAAAAATLGGDASSAERKPIHVMGFASINIEADGWSSAGCIPAIEMALHDLNARPDILADYELRVDMKDTRVRIGFLFIFSFVSFRFGLVAVFYFILFNFFFSSMKCLYRRFKLTTRTSLIPSIPFVDELLSCFGVTLFIYMYIKRKVYDFLRHHVMGNMQCSLGRILCSRLAT